MKERPILFSAPMVRAILAGDKTQTRRAIKPQPEYVELSNGVPWGKAGHWSSSAWCWQGHKLHELGREKFLARCPYGQLGDRLWVRETFDWNGDDYNTIHYRATHDEAFDCFITRWRPSIHMPRWASRILLEITDVRVERLHDISEADALSEGVAIQKVDSFSRVGMDRPAGFAFRDLWISTGGDWESNPSVWVIEFKRVSP